MNDTDKRTTLLLASIAEEVTERGASGMAIKRVFTPQIVELTFSLADYHPVGGAYSPFRESVDQHTAFRDWCTQTDNVYGWRGKVVDHGPTGNDDGLWRLNHEQIAWMRVALERHDPVNRIVMADLLREHEGPVRLVGPVMHLGA